MSIYPKPSAPPLEPEIQFQYITYPQYIANSQYITQLPMHMRPYYNQNYHSNTKVNSEQNNNCFEYIATCIAFFCCCFVVDENRT